MESATRLISVWLLAACISPLSPSLAFHEPGHIPPTGTCRDESCREEKSCDEEKLRALKAKRDLKIKTFREIVAASEDTRQREAEALAEAQKQFLKFAEKIAEKGVVKVGKDVFKVPDEIVAAYKEAKISYSDKPASEKFLQLTKLYVETLLKDAGYKTAVERAKWVDTAVSGVLMDAMVLTKLKEAEFHAEQAHKQWLLGYEALMEARHLEDQIRRLEAECRANRSGGRVPSEEETDFETSGERDAEAAQRLLNEWKQVEGGFEDAEGNFHDADTAFEEALSIVQSQPSTRLGTLLTVTAASSSTRPIPVNDMTNAELAAEWNRFRAPMRRAFELIIKGMDSYHGAERRFYMLGASPRSSGQQSAPSGKSKRSGK